MARTQEQRKAETRSRLLSAAATLFAEQGYDAVSVDAVGDAADRTSGAVYAHFGGKQGLLLSIVESWQLDLAAVVEAEFATHPDLAGRLAALWRNFTDHPAEGATPWLLLEHELWLRAARDPEVTGPLARRYAEVRELMRQAFRTWVEDLDLTPAVPVDDLPQTVIATLIGLEMQRRVDPEAVSDDLAVGVLLSLFGVTQTVNDLPPADKERG